MERRIHPIGIFLLIVFFFIAAWVIWILFAITGAFSLFYPSPPKPAITYGEFPFRVVYEVSGETLMIEDTVICEYTGVVSRGTAGKYRTWTWRLESGNTYIVFLRHESEGLTIEISMTYFGFPEYYMGDYSWRSKRDSAPKTDFSMLDSLRREENSETWKRISAEDALEQFGLRIIEVEYSDPIENRFG